MPNKPCSICESAVVDQINEKLEAGTSLRDLEKTSGFSRSMLSVHFRKHVTRQKLEANREKSSTANKRVIIAWPSGQYSIQRAPNDRHGAMAGKIIPEAELLPDDVLIRVTFDDGTPIKNPRALTPETPSPEELICFPTDTTSRPRK